MIQFLKIQLLNKVENEWRIMDIEEGVIRRDPMIVLLLIHNNS